MDVDQSGIVEINDIKQLYNVKNNREVREGRKTEEDIYGEFLETFELHHNLRKGCRDRRVTKDEFLEYYANISMYYDDDDYFVEFIRNAWKLGSQSRNQPQAAWAADVQVSPAKKRTTAPYDPYSKPGTFKNAPFGTDSEPVNYTTSNNPKGRLRAKQGGVSAQKPAMEQSDDVVSIFREKMAARGTRGIMSMRRAFMIADDDNSKTIDINEFAKFCHDYRVNIYF